MIDSAYNQLTDAQLRAIRRREYYTRRVKADFAPRPDDDDPDNISSPDEFRGDGSPLSPYQIRQKNQAKEKKRRGLEARLAKKAKDMPEWDKHVNLKKSGVKYMKNSEKMLLLSPRPPNFEMRSQSTILKRKRYDQELQSIDQGLREGEIRLQLPDVMERFQSRQYADLLSKEESALSLPQIGRTEPTEETTQATP